MRINIGCGLWPITGWKNFDNSLTVRLARIPVFASALSVIRSSAEHRKFIEFARHGVIEYATAQRMPVQTGNAEVVYSSHMLEHLYPSEARAFLAEAKRVLCPGGIIRLAMPDLEMLARDYLVHGDADVFVEKTLLAAPACLGLLNKLKFLIANNRHHHSWMYDGRSLCKLLTECGFSESGIVPAGVTRIPNPAPLDLRERSDQSVYVEAIV